MKQQSDKEFVAMRRVVEVLEALDKEAQQRVMAYAYDRITKGAPQQQLPLAPAVGVSQ